MDMRNSERCTKRVAAVVTLASICVGATPAFAGPILARVTAGQRVTVGNANLGAAGVGGVDGLARAFVLPPPPVVLTDKSTKTPPDDGDTNIAADAGGTTVAEARAKWKVSAAIGMVLGTAGTFAEVRRPDDTGPHGGASFLIQDPLVYDDAAGEVFDFSYGLLAGDFGLQALGEGGEAALMATARSNLPDLSTLFTLSLSLSGDKIGGLDVDFVSAPLLGLDDAAIANAVRSVLVFDAASNNYLAGSDLEVLAVTLTVPTSQNQAVFAWDTAGQTTAVPEAPVAVLLLGGVVLLGCREMAVRRIRTSWRPTRLP